MSCQLEQRHLGQKEHGLDIGQDMGFELQQTVPGRVPPGGPTTLAPEPLPPFSGFVEMECQDCGGKGSDPGSVNTREPEDCPACRGSGREMILRNYLAEAFRIAADPETNLQLERGHLVALTAYARQTVSALLMSLPEVA